MFVVDDGGEWEDFVQVTEFIAAIIESIDACWRRIVKPDPDLLENEITKRLYVKLNRELSVRQLPLRVLYQHHEISGAELEMSETIVDLHFLALAPRDASDFVSFECKRLCARVGKDVNCRGLWGDYIDGKGQGMTAFVSGRYPSPYGHAGMIGYILCKTIREKDVAKKMNTEIIDNGTLLCLADSSIGISLCKIVPGAQGVWESSHHQGPHTMHHIFLDADDVGVSLLELEVPTS
jgi:hypothetical protein